MKNWVYNTLLAIIVWGSVILCAIGLALLISMLLGDVDKSTTSLVGFACGVLPSLFGVAVTADKWRS